MKDFLKYLFTAFIPMFIVAIIIAILLMWFIVWVTYKPYGDTLLTCLVISGGLAVAILWGYTTWREK